MIMMRHRSAPPSAPRLSELDALRGIAAFLVLVHHARVLGLDPRPFDDPLLDRGVHMLMHFSPLRVLEFGREAVLFFFVLSGYVLTRALLRNGSPGLPAFAAQRTIRLVLPVTASVLLSAGLFYALLGNLAALPEPLRGREDIGIWQEAPGFFDVLREGALLRTQSDPVEMNPVLWSLVHEWRLTLFLPLVLLFHGRIWWLLALGCVGMALGSMASGSENKVMLGPQFHSTVVASVYFTLAIASGAALALAGPPPALTRDQRLAAGVASVAPFGLASDFAAYIASVLLIVVAQQPSGFRRFLRGAPLVWLGQVSYSLYLVHVPVLAACVVALHGTVPLWASLVVGLAASLAAAEAMHRLVEAPSRDLARWAERRLRRRADPGRGVAGARPEAARRGPTWAGEGGLFDDLGGAVGADAPASATFEGRNGF